MPRWMSITAVVFSSLGLLATSSCMAVSSPSGFAGTSPAGSYSFERNSSSGSASSGSLFGTSSSTTGSASSSSGTYASASSSSTGDPDSAGAVPPGYSNDSAQSSALTSYLQKNRLPLVGAQVLTNGSGNREVILYGFVATDFGKQDAVDKARRYLHAPDVAVVNRIAVRPELLASNGSGAPSSAPSTPPSGSYSPGGVGSLQSYENQTQQAQSQQYLQNQNGLAALVPLIGMMGLLSMGNSSFGMGYGGYPPTYGSPFSPFGAPYSPYPMTPYGSPYASPYGTPYYGYGGGFTFP